MLTNIALNVIVLALSALVATAAPTEVHKRDATIFNTCANGNQVALTFDDGPYVYEQDIAGRIAASGSKATFFLNGINFDCIYNHVDEIRALHAAGHTVASHGWSHKHMTTLSRQPCSWSFFWLNRMHTDLFLWRRNDELARVEEAFIRILGLRPRLFRSPYGEYNDLLLSVLNERGYTGVILWNKDTQDGSEVPASFSKGVYNQVNGGDIVLGHSVYGSTANDVVPYGIRELKNKGLDLVAVDTCLGTSWPYEYVGEPQSGNWQC